MSCGSSPGVRIYAMFAEFHGKAVERAGVQALQEAFDDELRSQIEPGNLPNYFGLQILLDGWHTTSTAAPRDVGFCSVGRTGLNRKTWGYPA